MHNIFPLCYHIHIILSFMMCRWKILYTIYFLHFEMFSECRKFSYFFWLTDTFHQHLFLIIASLTDNEKYFRGKFRFRWNSFFRFLLYVLSVLISFIRLLCNHDITIKKFYVWVKSSLFSVWNELLKVWARWKYSFEQKAPFELLKYVRYI